MTREPCLSIYSNLFRYRPRPERRPLEDFLSQALADLLNRLPDGKVSCFLEEVLLKGTHVAEAWHAFIRSHPTGRLRWETQVAIPGGVIDLLLRRDGDPVIVVENKIGAPVRTHASGLPEDVDRASGDIVRADSNQLRTYGRWLSGQAKAGKWPGALILLTHFSEPPGDFASGSYGVPHTSVCRWRSIWTCARRAGIVDEYEETVGQPSGTRSRLWSELADFLEEEAMSSDFASMQDIATAQIFIGSASRIARTFALVEEKLGDFKKQLGAANSKIYPPAYSSEGGLIWAYAYLKGPAKVRDTWYIAWGIRFPAVQSTWWRECDPALPDVPHAFVNVGRDDRGPELPIAHMGQTPLPKGWSSDAKEGELIAGWPAHRFPQDPEGWAESFATWVATEAEKIRPVVIKMAKELGK